MPATAPQKAALLALLPAGFPAVLTAAGDGVSPSAYSLYDGAFTNSIVTSWVISILLILVIRRVAGRPQLVPGKGQLVVESMVEGIRGVMAPIVGERMIKKVFPLLICFFTFILIHNWSGLIPGVGTFGSQRGGGGQVQAVVGPDGSITEVVVTEPGSDYEPHYEPAVIIRGDGEGAVAKVEVHDGHLVSAQLLEGGSGYTQAATTAKLKHQIRYWFRPGNADLNMTIALALISFGAWFYFVFRYTPVRVVVYDLFGNKANKDEVPKLLYGILFVIFFAVGIIEIISILFRPVSLSFRLYGNMYGGENLLTSITHLVHWVVPVPFYFLELLVGIVQAFVFTLLTAVYIGLICNHDGGEEHAH